MMKKRALINSLFVILIVLSGMGLGFGLSKMAAARRSAGTVNRIIPQQEKATDTQSLRERARQARRYVSDEGPNRGNMFADLTSLANAAIRRDAARSARGNMFADLTSLANSSSAVIVGVPQDNASATSPTGKRITLRGFK